MKGIILLCIAIGILCLKEGEKPKVYFTKNISPEAMVDMYKKLGVKLEGNVALKVHSGETRGKYFLTPDFLQQIYDYVKGTYVECNTAYQGHRHTTALHEEIAKEHRWTANNRKFVIMDAKKENDWSLKVNHQGGIIKNNIVGEHLKDFDSCLVLSHLKGHPMGGFGGALKQLSIGFASQAGKANIHSAGKTLDWTKSFGSGADQMSFTTAMAEAASSIVEYFTQKKQGGLAYVTVIANISLSCDCMGESAPKPKIDDIGILSSLDPVAIDQAGLDLIRKSPNQAGKNELFNQIERLKGENIIKVAEQIGIGSTDYELIEVD